MLIFQENTRLPVVQVSMKDLPLATLLDVLESHQFLQLPRLSSQEVFDHLCPPESSKTRKRLCVILISPQNGKYFQEFSWKLIYYWIHLLWCPELSVTTNLQIFHETEFVYLILRLLRTANVKNSIHFRWKNRGYCSYRIGETIWCFQEYFGIMNLRNWMVLVTRIHSTKE